MINTFGELFAAIVKWLDTPFERKPKLPEPSEYKDILNHPQPPHGDYPSILDGMFDPELQLKAKQRYNEMLLEQERSRRRYDDFYRKVNHIPFCSKCQDVGCDECSQWPMNNGDIK